MNSVFHGSTLNREVAAEFTGIVNFHCEEGGDFAHLSELFFMNSETDTYFQGIFLEYICSCER